jgi:hypothetical protein
MVRDAMDCVVLPRCQMLGILFPMVEKSNATPKKNIFTGFSLRIYVERGHALEIMEG